MSMYEQHCSVSDPLACVAWCRLGRFTLKLHCMDMCLLAGPAHQAPAMRVQMARWNGAAYTGQAMQEILEDFRCALSNDISRA